MLMRFLRILTKLLVSVYISIVNLFFILIFYGFIKMFAHLFLPDKALHYIYENVNIVVLEFLPVIILLLYTLYCISPIHIGWMREKFGCEKFENHEEERLKRLVIETGINKKFKLYRVPNNSPNAMTFGFKTMGITSGMMSQLSDAEIRGVICHEYGHIVHKDFVFEACIRSLENFGIKSLRGIFNIIELLVGLLFLIPISFFPFVAKIFDLLVMLWSFIFRLLVSIIYGFSNLLCANLNKYGEYRCDRYAVIYGQGEGLLLFLKRLKEVEDKQRKPSWFARLRAEHPCTKNRIARLEKLLSHQKKQIEIIFDESCFR